MADQLPIIGGTRAINATKAASTSLIGRGLSAILNKETGLALNEMDARYRQARDIYNRNFVCDIYCDDDEECAELFGDEEMAELSDAFKTFQHLAGMGYGKAYFPLAELYQHGQGIGKNIDKSDYYSRLAFDWCFSNLALGDDEIYVDLGVIYEKWPSIADDEQAVLRVRKAADQGYADAQFNLGWLYANGRGLEQGDDLAVFWYEQAADQGHANAQCNLGWMYANGRGLEQDDEQAVFWYRKAAEQGVKSGQFNLGLMYTQGRVVEQNYEQAVFWYRKAAEQGFAFAQCNLGSMYDRGRGVEQDDTQAVLWYRKAAERGFAKGQCYLGYMYDSGRGVEQDNEQAVFWYRKAAEKGFAEAQHNLGCMYANGRCVEENIELAIFWCGKAAEQGHQESQETLTNLGINWKNT